MNKKSIEDVQQERASKRPLAHNPDSGSTHNSWWLQSCKLKQRFKSLSQDLSTDVLIIGAGITGLSVALELLQRNYSVVVCEANLIGSGTSGGTSAHLDAHPESGTKTLVNKLGEERAREYTRLRLEAIRTIEHRAGGDAKFRRLVGYYYTENADNCNSLQEEYEHARLIGLNVSWARIVPIPRAICGYEIRDMGRFSPVLYLNRLADAVETAGGRIFERTLANSPEGDHPTSLEFGKYRIAFKHVVCAVHCNYTDSLRLHMQLAPCQSYVVAGKIRGTLPDALFWDDSNPYFYVRRGTARGDTILVGGCDHRTGDGSEADAMNNLKQWVSTRFAVKEFVSEWSAELFEPTDGLPFIGKVAGKENVYIATGLSGTGLTQGTMGATILADLISTNFHSLKDVFSPGRIPIESIGNTLSEQLPAAKNYLNRLVPGREVDIDHLQTGEGIVGTINGNQAAVCRDRDGIVHQCNPLCTHMGGLVQWNPVEQTWDCPVHGGRFSSDGRRLYGPPNDDLKQVSDK